MSQPIIMCNVTNRHSGALWSRNLYIVAMMYQYFLEEVHDGVLEKRDSTIWSCLSTAGAMLIHINAGNLNGLLIFICYGIWLEL